MIRINIHEAKTHLSKYLQRVEQGERIVLCRRNVPVAELVPVSQRRREPRPVGCYPEAYTVPNSFFEPLPESVLSGFEGGDLQTARPEAGRMRDLQSSSVEASEARTAYRADSGAVTREECDGGESA